MAPGRLTALAALAFVVLLSFAPTAQAAITVTDLGSNQEDSTAPFTLTITTTAAAPAGSSIIIGSTAIGSDGNPSTTACSDSAAHTYTTDVNRFNLSVGVSAICSTHKIAAALPAGSFLTVTWTGGFSLTKRARAIAVTGLASNPLDRTASNGNNSTSPSSGPGGTTSQANELLIGLISDFSAPVGGAGFSPGTNGGDGANNCASGTTTYTALPGVGTAFPPSLFLMFCIVSAIDNYSANATTSSTWQALLATFLGALPPTIAKSFGAASVPLNGSTSLSFTITNPNAATALTVSFTDGLAPGLVVATPNGLTGSCGVGTITATPGSSTISLAGATLAGGASCNFSVNVTGTTAGVKPNSTMVNSLEAGPGNTATSSLTVVGPPSVTKVFGAASVSTNATTTLTFTLSNPNGGSALSGVGFNDPLPPAGLVVASPNGLTGSCGGGTITATAGSSTISLAGATLAAGASCTFTVSVTATAAGTQNNTTTAVTSTEGGPGNMASASINVVAAAAPAVPALSTWAQALVVLIVVLTALLFLRRHRAV